MPRYDVRATIVESGLRFTRQLVAPTASHATQRMAEWLRNEGWSPKTVCAEGVDDLYDFSTVVHNTGQHTP